MKSHKSLQLLFISEPAITHQRESPFEGQKFKETTHQNEEEKHSVIYNQISSKQ